MRVSQIQFQILIKQYEYNQFSKTNMSKGFLCLFVLSLVSGALMADSTAIPSNSDTKDCIFGQFKNPSGNCVECLSSCSKCKSLDNICDGCSEGYQLNSEKNQCLSCPFGNLACGENNALSAAVGIYSTGASAYLSPSQFNILSAPVGFFDTSKNTYISPTQIGALSAASYWNYGANAYISPSQFNILSAASYWNYGASAYLSPSQFNILSSKNPKANDPPQNTQSSSNLREEQEIASTSTSSENSGEQPLIGAAKGIQEQTRNPIFSPEQINTMSENRKLSAASYWNYGASAYISPSQFNILSSGTENQDQKKYNFVILPQNNLLSSSASNVVGATDSMVVFPKQNVLKPEGSQGVQKNIFILPSRNTVTPTQTTTNTTNTTTSQNTSAPSDTPKTILAYFDLKSCALNEYMDSQFKCQSCSTKCSTCVNSADQCLKCASDRIKVGWKCVTKQYVSFNVTFSLPEGSPIKQDSDVANQFKKSMIANILPQGYKKMSLDVITMTQFKNNKPQLSYTINGIVDKITNIKLQDLNKQITQKLTTSYFNGEIIVKTSSTSTYTEPQKISDSQVLVSMGKDQDSVKTSSWIAIPILGALSGVLLISLVIMSTCYWKMMKLKVKDSSSDGSDMRDVAINDRTPSSVGGVLQSKTETI